MQLREVPLPKVSSMTIVKMPKGSMVIGAGLSHRDDAPAAVVLVDDEFGEMVDCQLIVTSTADTLGQAESELIRSGKAQLIGIVSSTDTPTWAVYQVIVDDADDVTSGVGAVAAAQAD